MVFFTLEWHSMSLEPFSTLFRRKFPHRSLDEFPATSILRREDFLIGDTSRHIAPSSSWYDDLFSWTRIFLEEMDMVVSLVLSFWRRKNLLIVSGQILRSLRMTEHTSLQYRRCGHESCSPCTDDHDILHEDEYIYIFAKTQKEFPLFLSPFFYILVSSFVVLTKNR